MLAAPSPDIRPLGAFRGVRLASPRHSSWHNLVLGEAGLSAESVRVRPFCSEASLSTVVRSRASSYTRAQPHPGQGVRRVPEYVRPHPGLTHVRAVSPADSGIVVRLASPLCSVSSVVSIVIVRTLSVVRASAGAAKNVGHSCVYSSSSSFV